jgi:hypothetical protein
MFPRSLRPSFEALEDRDCPAVLFLLDVTGTHLTLIGDNGPNLVKITQDDLTDTLTVTGDAVMQGYSSQKIKQITIDLKGGRDKVVYDLVGGSNFEHNKELKVDLGSGNDEAIFNFANNGVGTATILDTLFIDVTTQQGDDTVTASFGYIKDTSVYLGGDLGTEMDAFKAALVGDIAGSDVLIKMAGGDGADSLAVIANKDVDIAATALIDVELKGGAGGDALAFLYRGELDGFLKFRGEGEAGRDRARVYLRIDPGSTGKLDGLLSGGTEGDALSFFLLDNSGGLLNILQALLDGGPHSDTASASPNVTVINVP